ncbi:MAG: hypothetical protein HYW77_00040 [Parcubacteria group bacterium]|nr:hypothetical protein [Parcubacteria group bacterium]
MLKNIKGLTPVVIIFIVLAVAAVGYLGLNSTSCIDFTTGKDGQIYICQTYFKKLVNKFSDFQSQVEQISDTSGWKTYRNDQYGFEVKYPPEWSIEEKYNYSVDRVYIRGKGDAMVLIAPIGWATGRGGTIRIENSDIFIDRLRATKETSLTESGDEFSSFIRLVDVPRAWTSENFIITDANIIDERIECGKPVSSDGECEFGDGVRYFGSTNIQDQKTINSILSTFKFID